MFSEMKLAERRVNYRSIIFIFTTSEDLSTEAGYMLHD
jgi:hypothetical protein